MGPQQPQEQTPAERPPSLFEVVRKLDKLSWDVQLLLADRERHTDSKKDERFLLMERDYAVIKRLAWAMLIGFAVAASTAVGMYWVRRAGIVPPDPPPANKAERMGMDVVPRPAPPAPAAPPSP